MHIEMQHGICLCIFIHNYIVEWEKIEKTLERSESAQENYCNKNVLKCHDISYMMYLAIWWDVALLNKIQHMSVNG